MSEAHDIVLVRKQIGEFAGISDFRPNPGIMTAPALVAARIHFDVGT
jgi:hypothetical protein